MRPLLLEDLHFGQKDYLKKAKRNRRRIKRAIKAGYKIISIGDTFSINNRTQSQG